MHKYACRVHFLSFLLMEWKTVLQSRNHLSLLEVAVMWTVSVNWSLEVCSYFGHSKPNSMDIPKFRPASEWVTTRMTPRRIPSPILHPDYAVIISIWKWSDWRRASGTTDKYFEGNSLEPSAPAADIILPLFIRKLNINIWHYCPD